jgi:transposase
MMTHEEIRAVYEQGPEAVIALVEVLYLLMAQQQEQVAQLQDRVTALEDRLATNSRNSSKPPPSDSFVKQTRSLRPPSQRKPGGQPGHPGATLHQGAEPDQMVQHVPAQCAVCGAALSEVVGRLGEERRQVFELPPLQLVVTEHRVVIKACLGCGQANAGAFPAGVSCGASYGAGVKSFLTALNQEYLIPSERSCQILADLFGQPISEGTLQEAVHGCAAALVETETHIKQGISHAEVAHFDETGM